MARHVFGDDAIEGKVFVEFNHMEKMDERPEEELLKRVLEEIEE